MDQKECAQIFELAQSTASHHQKCVIKLEGVYKKAPRAAFLNTFLKLMHNTIRQKLENAVYTKRLLSFAAMFCSDVTKKEEKENDTHDFLTAVVEQVLEWSYSDIYDMRYNSCFFISKVLRDIGEQIQLDTTLFDEIQRVLLDRMQESKIPIRLVTMSAMVRLQDPHNFECPVISAYGNALLSSNAQVRKEALEHIAPNMNTINKIKDRVRDVDVGVRASAFQKCADIGPLSFRIVDKHLILTCGFRETSEKAKAKFLDYLIPKWLTVYKGNYVKFIGALKLVADEEDISKMMSLSRGLIKEFFDKYPSDDLIAVLPINDEKLINVEDLENEVTLFWNILISLLREADREDHLNQILPELTPFCHYLSNVVQASTSSDVADEWKYFEHQFDLLNLFEIAEHYDFSDEVGRRTMQSLVMRLLQECVFTSRLTKKLVSIAHKCSSNIEFFTNDMCQLISDIREPLVEEPLAQDKHRERVFKMAALRVKINVVQEQQTEAIQERDYKKAQELDQELINLRKQLECSTSQTETEKVRVTKSDDETLCRCLDILIGVLELTSVNKLTPSLVTCRDAFLVPLISTQGAEPHWRILKCLALYSCIDRATAKEYAKLLCVPIATYRTIPVNNVSALVVSIGSVADLITLYGIEIVSPEEETVNTTSDSNGRRKLYSNDTEEDPAKIDNMTLSYIIEIFLDMLDDEREEVRRKAVLAISILVQQCFTMTPTVFSRILLKWYNPLTASQDGHLQAYLGLTINEYMRQKKTGEVVMEAMIPTLNTIAHAPRNSPLVDIDIDNVLMFFSAMINVVLSKDDLRILALDVCMKISEKPTDRIVLFLTKLLFHLDLDQINPTLMAELIERAEMLLENVSDKMPKKYVEKFIAKLRQDGQTRTNTTVDTTMQTTRTRDTTGTNESEMAASVLQEIQAPSNELNVPKKAQQIKRRKKENSKNCVVRLERLNLSRLNLNPGNETTLHTIQETSVEMDVDENLTIETVTSDSSNGAKRITRNTVVISETSDSDFSNDSEGARKSRRCRKKRII